MASRESGPFHYQVSSGTSCDEPVTRPDQHNLPNPKNSYR